MLMAYKSCVKILNVFQFMLHVQLTSGMIDRLVFSLQFSATDACDSAGRLHSGINDEPGAGEGRPLLREEKVKKTE